MLPVFPVAERLTSRCVGREVPIQQVRCHRQLVLRVRRDLEAPFVLRLDAVLLHQPLNRSLLAGNPRNRSSITMRGLP